VESPRSTTVRSSSAARFGAAAVAFDELDVVLLDGLGEAQADVAAAGDDDPADRLVHAAQLGHHPADVGGGGDDEDFVAALDDGVAGRRDG
jgi:hypothetical protein